MNIARRRTRIACTAALLMLLAMLLSAHPGIGIVRDSRGNVYYTDLKQVWKLAPDGTKSVAVPGVHTHELWMSPGDTLYGEHLWYDAGGSNPWMHRIWRHTPDGRVTDLIPARRGVREDFGDAFFVRDRSGAMYWADRGTVTAIRKRSVDGKVSVVARSRFTNVRHMTVADDGTLYLIDMYDVVIIPPGGTPRTLARGIARYGATAPLFSKEHAVMGIWSDGHGSVYTAVPSDSCVKRIDAQGNVTTLYKADARWLPVGGTAGPDGSQYILEFFDNDTVRVVRVDADGRKHVRR